MVNVSDMTRAVKFYRDKLGLPLKFETPGWTEFQTGTTVLALHGGGVAREQNAEPGTHIAGTCSIGFNVDDIEQTFTDLKAKGVTFIMPPTRREEDAITLAVALDPDGLPISFAQLHQQAAQA